MKEFSLYFKHLTLPRTLNLILCGFGFTLSRILRYPVVFGFPFSISVEPTTKCNLKCPDCVTGLSNLGRRGGDMSLELYRSIIDQSHRYTTTILLHFQGEPLLCPNIFEMVEYATSKKMITEMATNATLIDKEVAEKIVRCGLKKIVITIDSPNRSEFGFYRRGAAYDEVIEGIKNVVSAKKQLSSRYPLIVFELLAFSNNILLIKDFVDLSKALWVDVARIKSAQVLSPIEEQAKIPFNTKYSRYNKNDDGSIALMGKKVGYCSSPWFKLSITHNGWVFPCCFDKSGCYIMGSTSFSSLRDIWFSNHYNLLRNRLLHNRNQMPVCSTCPHNRLKLDFVLKI